jgi:Na+-translocating ferredoxin:NAD+ oxidoreductase RnfC subunit
MMMMKGLLNKIRDAGVIGAGGAGFPAHLKLDSKVNHIIANGVECEPLLYKDRVVMIRETEKMIKGLEIARDLTSAARVTIAIKKKNQDAADLISPLAEKKGFEIFITKDVYPAGDEYILVYEITGKRVPPNGIPLMIDCLVSNVETLMNIANAAEDKPVTNKYLTIAGAVKNPVTTHVPIGTSYEDCIDFAGGATVDNPAILTGGIMMGGVETDFSQPVTGTLGALIILPPDHNLVIRKTSPQKVYNKTGQSTCDQCTFCTQLCPRYILGYPILPHLVMRSLQMKGEAENLSLYASACCECNVCSLFACPEKLDPKNICADTKLALSGENKVLIQEQLNALFRDVHPVREGREIPISGLYQRLGIKKYDRKAEFKFFDKNIKQVLIPLKNKFGSHLKPIINEGSKVTAGQIIAMNDEDILTVPVHASIDGIIKSISEKGILISANY